MIALSYTVNVYLSRCTAIVVQDAPIPRGQGTGVEGDLAQAGGTGGVERVIRGLNS